MVARFLSFLIYAVIGLVLLVLALFGIIQTPPGKAVLARLASSLASTPGLAVGIEGISGFVPSDIGVERITLSDDDGVFATISGARLSWSPLALLNRSVDVTALEAAKVEVLRRPLPPPEPSAPPPASSSAPPLLPVRLERLAIGEIVLAEPVLGHAATLGLTASADLSATTRAVALKFELDRRDSPGRVAGTASFAPETRQLDLDLSAEEPTGGLIARAAGMDGLPELTASLKGSGTLDQWDGHLALQAGTIAQASGAAGIRAVPQGHRFTAAIDADISRLLPADLGPLFEGRTELAAAATLDPANRLAIESSSVRAAGFGASVRGGLDLDGGIAELTFQARVPDHARFAALAPGMAWQSGTLEGTVMGKIAAPAVDAHVVATGLSGAGYGTGTLTVDATTRPDAEGNLAVTAEGEAQGLTATEPQVAAALGPTARFQATGLVPAGDTALARLTGLTVHLTGLTARFTGTADQADIDGKLSVERLDLATLVPLIERPLAGQAQFDIGIQASEGLSRLTVTIDGRSQNVVTGVPAADGFFGHATTLTGAIERSGQSAISINNLRMNADGLSFAMDGRLDTTAADLRASLDLADLARLDPRVTGAVKAQGAFSGSLDDLKATAEVSIPSGTAMGKPIQGLTLAFTGNDITGNPSATFRLNGTIAGQPATGSGSFASAPNDRFEVQELDIAIGSARATGDVTVTDASLATGRLILAAPNLADLSPLALTELAGSLNADIGLDISEGRQRVVLKGNAERVAAAGQSVAMARIDATVIDPIGVPALDGTVEVRGANISGQVIENATIRGKGGTDGTDLTVDATVQNTALRAAGRLSRQGDGARLRLDRLSATRGGTTIASTAPANIVYAGGTVTIDRLALNAGGGTATLAGSAGERLDLTADLRAIPLSLAELAAPGLNLSGTLAGNARVTGTPAAPTGNYQLTITRLSTPDVARAGAGPFDITARGDLAGGRATLRSEIRGRYLQALAINGSVPLGAGALDLAIRGGVDLGILNPMLATTGAQVAGNAAVNATVTGTASAPNAGGTIRISGGRYIDSLNGISLDRIEALLTGTQRSVTLTSLSARTANGGGLTGRGNVGLDPAAGFPGRIEIDMANAQLVNSELMRLVTEGRIAVEGAFLNNPRVTGRMVVRALDVNIPDRLPGGVQSLNVRHVNAGARSVPGAGRPGRREPRPADTGIPLDLTISAPNNVFVRGMGIEAELGGDIQLRGTSTAPVAMGGFEMRRGNFDFVGRRLSFTRGRVTFTGTTDPELDFVAETTANDVTARIIVTGPASAPEIDFTSNPTLPQDEILSRLLFGRSVGQLSSGQALQIAQTVAQFSGGGGMLNDVRRSLGVDSLELGTDDAGTGGQVGVGRRLNDNIYLGVRQGTSANSSKVTVDIDVTKNIRLQGATSAGGSAEVGIGAQWDY
ncbi:translocation/assembly module TamB domain-containing protein [Ancylobacter oerskovii]|uniref:Translocation/assembly module TamB domain-containing protein n=1 Tax=Ancylobacter oerskovii TaxID=459519 RepID=A0ABW4YYK1_9HYPH|nr:translocation/assembly module TamB domain-containing protein [Ancylobacter oerskovii]MBS7541589.1 translocation/assembly module TamB domain-containing protein [Ancylobacter oerskovii]